MKKEGMEMRSWKPLRAAKTGYVILSAVLCALGILLLLFPRISMVALCYLLGGILVAYGVVKMIGYFSRDLYRLAFQYDLAFGILFAVIGALILCDPTGAAVFLALVSGVLVLADGLFKVQMALDAKAFGIRKWWAIMALAVLAGAFGLLLILRPAQSARVAMALFGLTLLAEGLLGICVALCAVEVIRRREPGANGGGGRW